MIRTKRRKAKRGFAAMSPEKRREIARKGGLSVKPENRAFSQNHDLAVAAGRKGGAQSPGKRRRRRVTPQLEAATDSLAQLLSEPGILPAIAEAEPVTDSERSVVVAQ